jgi:hypothetical protein
LLPNRILKITGSNKYSQVESQLLLQIKEARRWKQKSLGGASGKILLEIKIAILLAKCPAVDIFF